MLGYDLRGMFIPNGVSLSRETFERVANMLLYINALVNEACADCTIGNGQPVVTGEVHNV